MRSLPSSQVMPLSKCTVMAHENCENPELSYRAIKVTLKEKEDDPEMFILLASSVTEKAQWLADFAQVGGANVCHVTHVLSCDLL